LETAIILNLDMLLVLGILSLSVVLFVTEWLAADLTALLLLVLLGLTGLVPINNLFSGFASNAVISILAVMILGAGLDRTGLMNRAADFILRLAGDTERRLILALSAVAGSVSGFMQNPAAAALFIPVASRIASRTGYPIARLLLPMAVCIVLGGTMTTVGNSPMILLSDLIESTNKNLPQGAQVLDAPKLFSVFPIGLALLISGLLYFYFFGLRRLPASEEDSATTPRTTEAYFEKLYGVGGSLVELRVYPDSAIAGMHIGQLEQLIDAPLFLALKSGEETKLAPAFDEVVHAGSVLAVMADQLKIEGFAGQHGLGVLPGQHHLGSLFDAELAGVSEAVIPPSSNWIGKSASDLRLRKRFGINLLAILRNSQTLQGNVRANKIQAGDTLVFHSSWQDLAEHVSEREFIVITDFPKTEPRQRKQFHALFFFISAFALALVAKVPLPVALMAGATGMMMSGVLSTDEAYRAINWKTIFSLACLIPLSAAIDQTGTAAWIAQVVERSIGGLGSINIQIVLAIVASIAALALGQVGATVLMVPIAINIALTIQASPMAFAIIVSLGASNNLISASNPVIGMIMGPSGYQQRDFVRVCWPLSALFVLLSVLLVNLLF
jgi:di/tricarboxylate transporter